MPLCIRDKTLFCGFKLTCYPILPSLSTRLENKRTYATPHRHTTTLSNRQQLARLVRIITPTEEPQRD
jgi:hypothetical protein